MLAPSLSPPPHPSASLTLLVHQDPSERLAEYTVIPNVPFLCGHKGPVKGKAQYTSNHNSLVTARVVTVEGHDTCAPPVLVEPEPNRTTSRSYRKGSSKDHKWAWGTGKVKPCPTKPMLEPTGCPAELAFTTTCTMNQYYDITLLQTHASHDQVLARCVTNVCTRNNTLTMLSKMVNNLFSAERWTAGQEATLSIGHHPCLSFGISCEYGGYYISILAFLPNREETTFPHPGQKQYSAMLC